MPLSLLLLEKDQRTIPSATPFHLSLHLHPLSVCFAPYDGDPSPFTLAHDSL